MAQIAMDLGHRDTKRWHTCLSCLIKELENLNDKKVNLILNKFQAEVGLGGEGEHFGLGMVFPKGYPVPQELI